MAFMRSFTRTMMGGNARQRAWLQTQMDKSGRLPPFRDPLGMAMLLGFLVGSLVIFFMGITGVSSSVSGPFAMFFSVLCGLCISRFYRWLRTSPEFQALA